METTRDNLPNFENKTVTFYSASWKTTDILAVISSPSFELQAGRLFLVGQAAATSSSWACGSSVGVAWDDVSAYVAIDSDEFEEKRKQHRAQRRNSTSRGIFDFLKRH